MRVPDRNEHEESIVTEEQFIFPLGTVLFPGAALPLKIFEQRYIEMTKTCLRDDRPFGVCLIREGREVGDPALPQSIGCLAKIEQWDMPQMGLFHLLSRGTERFRLAESRVAKNGLITGVIERLPPEEASADVDDTCRRVLEAIIERMDVSAFPKPFQLDDASWVGFRLGEVLPLDMRIKQELLEMTDASQRLARIRAVLMEEGLIVRP
jgi:Lon protease-like protein